MAHSSPGYAFRSFLRNGLLCLAVGLAMSIPVHAQAPRHWSLALRLAGSGIGLGQAAKVDRDGNTYVTGYFSATAFFQAQSGSGKSLTSAGGIDSFLAKYDPSGRLSWLLRIGGSGDDTGFDIAFDAARNVYVVGTFTDTATFQGAHGSGRTVSGSGSTLYLAKYSSAGVLSWVQTGIADNSTNNGYGVAVEPAAGAVYVTGVSQGGATFSSSNGTTHTVSGGPYWHMLLAKFDLDGHFQWAVTNDAAPNSAAHKVAVDADANAYVTGWMEGHTVFHSNDGNDLAVDGFSGPVQTYPDFPGDAFLVKYDENGNAQWVNHVGGYKAIGTDIAVSRDGRVSITGLV